MRLLYFLYYFVIENKFRISLILISLIFTYTLYNSNRNIYKYPIVGEFNHEGDRIVFYDDEYKDGYNVVKKPNPEDFNEAHIDTETNELVRKEFTPWQIIGGIFIIVSGMILLISGIDGSTKCKVYWCRAQAGSRFVKVYEENGLYYYKYKNKLLHKSDYQMQEHYIISLVYDFHKQSSNMYPDFEEPPKKNRNTKIGNILGQEQV